MTRSAVAFALVGVFLLTMVPIPTSKAVPDAIHRFECGEDAAPSGPYLNMTSGVLYDYSCLLGTLTPLLHSYTECYVVGTGGAPIPIAGVCALLNKDAWNEHSPRFKVAIVGVTNKIEWQIRDASGVRESGVGAALYDGVVVYWSKTAPTYTVPCGPPIHVQGHLILDDREHGHDNSISQC